MIVSVVGNILSGKSTLSKKISELYGFTYIPQKRNELFFLDDFFDNIPSMFFETQISFLVSKVLEIEEKVKENCDVVIDRSILEDISIFAKFWMDNYEIEEREKILYKRLSEYIIRSVPQSDIFFYCKCKKSTLINRFNSRTRRSFEKKYPNNYIENLCKMYDDIVFPEGSLVVEIDCDHVDVREDDVVIAVINILQNYIKRSKQFYQFSFFENSILEETNDIQSDLCSYINIYYVAGNLKMTEEIFKLKKKTIYLAAPFTEFATIEPISANTIEFNIKSNREYFILPEYYQTFLLKLKKYLSNNGRYLVFLPHQEENNWGKTYITNEQVISSMIDNIKKSDLIFALVSNSIGVHMEIAMMAVLDKPMILVLIGDLTNGFYAKGLENRNNVLLIKVESINEAKEIMKETKVLDFIVKELEKNEKK